MSMTTSARQLTASRKASRASASDRLSTPAVGRSRLVSRRAKNGGRRMDREAFSQMAESIARFLGTGRYLAIQTIVVAVWIFLNITFSVLRWDPYPFILLNLAFSTQAAYAAPLILLAQNRQASRDRLAMEEDRRRAAMQKADTEYLAREIAALRIALGEVATRDFVRAELTRLLEELDESGRREPGLREAVRRAEPGRQAARRDRRQPQRYERDRAHQRPGDQLDEPRDEGDG